MIESVPTPKLEIMLAKLTLEHQSHDEILAWFLAYGEALIEELLARRQREKCNE